MPSINNIPATSPWRVCMRPQMVVVLALLAAVAVGVAIGVSLVGARDATAEGKSDRLAEQCRGHLAERTGKDHTRTTWEREERDPKTLYHFFLVDEGPHLTTRTNIGGCSFHGPTYERLW